MISGNRPLGLWQKIVLYGMLAVFFIAVTFPFYWIFLTSLKTGRDVYDTTSILIPKNLTIINYVSLFTKTDIVQWIVVSTSVALASTFIAVVIGVLAAFSLTDFRYRGRKPLSMAIFISYVVPQALLFIPLFLLMNRLRLVDTYWGLVVAYQTFTVPFSTWMLLGYFRTLPAELKDAARIDGCTQFGVLFRIIIPLAAPGIATAAIFSFTQSWNEFLYAATLAHSAGMKTFPLGLASFLDSDVYIWGQMMGGAIIATAPMVVLFAFLQRFVVHGLTLGGVKG